MTRRVTDAKAHPQMRTSLIEHVRRTDVFAVFTLHVHLALEQMFYNVMAAKMPR
jgi:hypothetical protein